jgi:hypothetical protein
MPLQFLNRLFHLHQPGIHRLARRNPIMMTLNFFQAPIPSTKETILRLARRNPIPITLNLSQAPILRPTPSIKDTFC